MLIKLKYIDAETKDKVNLVLLNLLPDHAFYYYPETDQIELCSESSIWLITNLASEFKIFIVKNRWLLAC